MATPKLALTTYGPGLCLASQASGQALSAAANRQAYGFMPLSNRTLNAVRIYIVTVTGSPAASDIQLDLYDDGGGVPGSILQSKVLASLTAAAWNEWTGFTTALTAYTQYWLALRNLNGTPASNFVTPQRGAANCIAGAFTSQNVGPATKASLDSGSTWATAPIAGGALMRTQYADGYDGYPIQTIAAGAAGTGVYAGKKCGNRFTSPSPWPLLVKGVVFPVSATNSPTVNAQVEVYEGTTLVATSQSIPKGNIQGGPNTGMPFWFFSTLTVKPATDYRVVVAEPANADASTVRYNVGQVTLENDANSIALKPWSASLVLTYFDGSTWAEANSNIYCPFEFVLDPSQEFQGSPLNRGILAGQMM